MLGRRNKPGLEKVQGEALSSEDLSVRARPRRELSEDVGNGGNFVDP